MSLQFIMGPSGSGKSHYLYQKVTEESIKHPEKNFFVIVPDQFTMQTQKDMVMASPHKGIMNVDVLSFNRLAYRIFEETGEKQKTVLDDIGKNFILRKVANREEAELRVLGGNLKKTGFISQIKSVISEFTQYDIQEKEIEDLLNQVDENTSFYYKLRDIQKVYRAFKEYLGENYITGEELLDVLSAAVPKSKLLKDSVIVLDGFTGFTPVQNKLLKHLLQVCEEMKVTVTVAEHSRSEVLFVLSDKMMDTLGRIADECHVEILQPIRLDRNPVYRFRENEPLAFLESHLFRYTKQQYTKDQEVVQIYYSTQPSSEMNFVAEQIRKLVRIEGLRYRDIAVIASDVDSYANHVEKTFETYDIPYFMDCKRNILLNSFVEYLRSLLAMAEQDFSYESVFRYLRTDLVDFARDEIDLLENYCVAMGIRGYKKWKENWVRRTTNMDLAELAVVNEIRAKFVAGITEVMTVLKQRFKTVRDVTEALYQFLSQQELQMKVKKYATDFANAGELALEKEYSQIYRIVIDLFDKFVALLGDERISLKEYCELLEAGLEEAKVGIIPPSSDQVVIGDIERTRIKDVKVLFFVGVNDCYIPAPAGSGNLLSERDREKFQENGIVLAPSAKEKMFLQKFYLYLLLTKPSERVVVTYSKVKSGGEALRPAYLISDLLKMFPRLKVCSTESFVRQKEFTKNSGISYLVEGLQHKEEGLSTAWQELYCWYKKDPEWRRTMEQIVEAAFYRKEQEILTPEAVEELYGSTLFNSVSRLERFSACAYAHFLSYGLRLQEREEYQFQAMDMGNLLHGAMERYAKKLEQGHFTWTNIPDAEREQLIEECVEESIVDYGNTILYSSARNEYTITRLRGVMRRTVWALTRQLEKGDFVPKDFEYSYMSDVILLEGMHGMRVSGKIDRIDVCEQENERYVKVIDYKSGQKDIDLEALYYGLQMQLVVYMNEALKKEKKEHPNKHIIPAGLFYFCMQNPLVDRVGGSDSAEENLLMAMRPSGIVNASENILKLLDDNFEKASQVVPVSRTKTGKISHTKSTLSTEEFELISEFAEHKMVEIGKRIMSGEIAVSPYRKGTHHGCMYCPYAGVCGFDEKIAGYGFNDLTKDKSADALEKMRKEAETWE